MTLEDFFTLTEMNNGLTAPSRVRELMAVMQKERDSIMKNSADSTRQWSAVASAIAATENKECLDLFIQLDGLHFISKWLKDAQKFSNDSVDSFVEESISHLLRALKKLHVEYEKLVASEIWATVQDLLVHNSLKVREEARALSEIWRISKDCDAATSDVEKSRTLTDDEAAKSADPEGGIRHMESSAGDDSNSQETSKEKSLEMAKDDEMLSTDPDAVHTGQLEIAQDSDKILDTPVIEKLSDERGSPSLPRSTVEPSCLSVGTSIEPCSPAVLKLDVLDAHTEINGLKSPSYQSQSPKTDSSLQKLCLAEESKPSEDRIISSSTDAVDDMKPAVKVSSLNISVAGKKGLGDEGLSYIESSDKKVADDNDELSHPLLRKEDRKANTPGQKRGDLLTIYNSGKKHRSRKPDRAGKKSGLEMDYGIFDPLEVARQVAIEVGRENEDSGEQSGGSSEQLPENNMQLPESPDCTSGKQSHASEDSFEVRDKDPDLSDKSSPMQEDSASSSESLDGEQTNDSKDIANSQIVETSKEEANLQKGLCDFDLNEEVVSEGTDHPGDQSLAPISIVAASRSAAAPAIPGAPLQFEGNLGWKGSAATSAFRRASPRRTLENDKDPSAGRSGNSSKQQVCLEFDLNVGESVVTREGGALPDKHGTVFPCLPSGESSVEENSRRSEHLELDLNCVSEDCATPSDCQIRQFFPYGNHSNSSSSSKQPIGNINLNDQPSFLNDSSDNCHLSMASQNIKVSGSVKSDDSVISIMGTRVEVNRKDYVSPSPSLSNGRASELAFDVNLGRTGGFLAIGPAIPYTHSSVYGFNNIAPAPAPAMPFSSTLYGSAGPFPGPYMVDSRGAPVIPQIVGQSSFSQPPFVVNMNGFTPPNGIRPLNNSFDTNPGILVESGSGKDPAGFGLFLNPTQVRSVDEQLRSHSQPAMSSTLSGKRKEPDNGWEQYPFKPYMPPWKRS